MTEATKDFYLGEFRTVRERSHPRMGRPGLSRCAKLRLRASLSWDFPTTHHEEWKYTNVAPITRVPFPTCPAPAVNRLAAEALAAAVDPGSRRARNCLCQWPLCPELSRPARAAQGVEVGSLAMAFSSARPGSRRTWLAMRILRTRPLWPSTPPSCRTGLMYTSRVGASSTGQSILSSSRSQQARPPYRIPAICWCWRTSAQATVIESYIGLATGCVSHQRRDGIRPGPERCG